MSGSFRKKISYVILKKVVAGFWRFRMKTFSKVFFFLLFSFGLIFSGLSGSLAEQSIIGIPEDDAPPPRYNTENMRQVDPKQQGFELLLKNYWKSVETGTTTQAQKNQINTYLTLLDGYFLAAYISYGPSHPTSRQLYKAAPFKLQPGSGVPFFDWVEDIRFELGAKGNRDFVFYNISTFTNRTHPALINTQDRYVAYARSRDFGFLLSSGLDLRKLVTPEVFAKLFLMDTFSRVPLGDPGLLERQDPWKEANRFYNILVEGYGQDLVVKAANAVHKIQLDENGQFVSRFTIPVAEGADQEFTKDPLTAFMSYVEGSPKGFIIRASKDSNFFDEFTPGYQKSFSDYNNLVAQYGKARVDEVGDLIWRALKNSVFVVDSDPDKRNWRSMDWIVMLLRNPNAKGPAPIKIPQFASTKTKEISETSWGIRIFGRVAGAGVERISKQYQIYFEDSKVIAYIDGDKKKELLEALGNPSDLTGMLLMILGTREDQGWQIKVKIWNSDGVKEIKDEPWVQEQLKEGIEFERKNPSGIGRPPIPVVSKTTMAFVDIYRPGLVPTKTVYPPKGARSAQNKSGSRRTRTRQTPSDWVEVEYTVSPEGKVIDAVVVAASKPEVHDQAALEAITQWEYYPYKQDGRIFAVTGVRIKFNFQGE